MIIYRFQVIQTSRDPTLPIFIIVIAYLVHHTLNRNGTYTGRKLNPLSFDEKSLTNESQHKSNSETNKSTFFAIQNQCKKV